MKEIVDEMKAHLCERREAFAVPPHNTTRIIVSTRDGITYVFIDDLRQTDGVWQHRVWSTLLVPEGKDPYAMASAMWFAEKHTQ